MKEARLWMVRGEGGRLYDTFREQSIVAIGWAQLGRDALDCRSREDLIALYKKRFPQAKDGSVTSSVSQVWRFLRDLTAGDLVTTYSPSNRTYLVGRVLGDAECRVGADPYLTFIRKVEWKSGEVERDQLSGAAKNSLGSTLTVFVVPDFAAKELLASTEASVSTPSSEVSVGDSNEVSIVDSEGVEDQLLVADPISTLESLALERIKDRVAALSWEDMQFLVAGVLRAMGYKTQVSPAGPDRGKDIIASPDGFGFENPRIVVEVKHRSGQMGSQAIRSFLGGRHKDDRGLYVSTGGFSKDAYYEADRATIPVMLWTMDNMVRTLLEHYDATDAETKRLVPLRKTYVPA